MDCLSRLRVFLAQAGAEEEGASAVRLPFDASVITDIYRKEIKESAASIDYSRFMMLEFTGFLENYLWPNFDAATSSFEHVMCIILVRALSWLLSPG